MATNFTNDLIATKLAAHYPSAKKHFADLWFTYWNDAAGGNNGGREKTADALYAHYGGPEAHIADRANRFWTNYV